MSFMLHNSIMTGNRRNVLANRRNILVSVILVVLLTAQEGSCRGGRGGRSRSRSRYGGGGGGGGGSKAAVGSFLLNLVWIFLGFATLVFLVCMCKIWCCDKDDDEKTSGTVTTNTTAEQQPTTSQSRNEVELKDMPPYDYSRVASGERDHASHRFESRSDTRYDNSRADQMFCVQSDTTHSDVRDHTSERLDIPRDMPYDNSRIEQSYWYGIQEDIKHSAGRDHTSQRLNPPQEMPYDQSRIDQMICVQDNTTRSGDRNNVGQRRDPPSYDEAILMGTHTR